MRFRYIEDVAAKYGVDEVILDGGGKCRDVHTFMGSLAADDLEQLARGYNEIVIREDSAAISRWIWEHADLPESREILHLMVLFRRLRERGILPFADGQVRLIENPEKLDWSKLPPSLSFLIEPANNYGRIEYPAQVSDFLEAMDETTEAYLLGIWERVKAVDEQVQGFLECYGLAEHPEAARVYYLMLLCDAVCCGRSNGKENGPAID